MVGLAGSGGGVFGQRRGLMGLARGFGIPALSWKEDLSPAPDLLLLLDYGAETGGPQST